MSILILILNSYCQVTCQNACSHLVRPIRVSVYPFKLRLANLIRGKKEYLIVTFIDLIKGQTLIFWCVYWSFAFLFCKPFISFINFSVELFIFFLLLYGNILNESFVMRGSQLCPPCLCSCSVLLCRSYEFWCFNCERNWTLTKVAKRNCIGSCNWMTQR